MSRSCPGHDDAADSGRYPDITVGDGGDTISSFPDMIADYSIDDLFELAWEQGGGGSGGASGSTAAAAAMMLQPAASHLWSPPAPPWSDDFPPSESEMAAWLRAIVNGEELAFDDELKTTVAGGGDRPDVAAAKGSREASTTEEKEKLIPVMEGMMGSGKEMRKLPAGGSSRRSSQHGDAAHNLTEKRRRHKINEKLRTLQQLVPGCDDKSNQASTLDQTIQYLKSLQHHIQAMSVVPSPVAPAIAMPMPPAAPMVLAPAAPAMGPFGGMLHLPGGHYPVDGLPVMMPAAAAAPLYPPAAPPRAAAPPPGGVRSSSTGHWQGSSSSCKGKGGSRSLRHQKH